MKSVILLRHAKSDWSDAVTRDFDRPLNDRGRRAAQVMGQWAKGAALHFDRVIASPAVRATETLATFMDSYGKAIDAHWDRRIYLASSATLLDVLRDQPDICETLLMVGHNPGLEDLVLDMVPEGGCPARTEVEIKYPTATIARLDFAADRWADIGRPAELSLFMRPRDIDATLGPDRS